MRAYVAVEAAGGGGADARGEGGGSEACWSGSPDEKTVEDGAEGPKNAEPPGGRP